MQMSWARAIFGAALAAGAIVFVGCGGGGNDNPTYMISVGRLKELNHGLQLYATDYDDVLPPAASWMDALGSYVPDPTNFHSPAVEGLGYGYALNIDVAGKSLTTIDSPDATLSIFDSTDLSRNATDSTNTMPNPPRYHGYNTIGYMDGHVKDEFGLHPSREALYGQSTTRLQALNGGLLIYASDNDGKLPLAGNWVDATLPYVRTLSTYRSPVVERRVPTDFGYAYNSALSGADLSTSDRGTTVSIFDSTILTRNASSDLSTLPRPPRYGSANTIVYLDGHVQPFHNPTVDDLYATSQRRLRQLTVSMITYASDYDGRLPLADQWMDVTYSYNHDSLLYHSPILERQGQNVFGYAFNLDLAGVDLSSLGDPVGTPLLFDSTVLTRNATALPSTMPNPARYGGRNTVSYADGHVP